MNFITTGIRQCRLFHGLHIAGVVAAGISIVAGRSVMATEIYRWSDAAGSTHFEDTPPSHGQYKSVNLDDGKDTPVGQDPRSEPHRAEMERRYQTCIGAQRRFILMARETLPQQPTPTSIAQESAESLSALPFKLEPLVTEPTRYWNTANKRWEFPAIPPTLVARSYMHAISANCDIGTAVEERQLASLNAEIQESNCRLLKQHFSAAKTTAPLSRKQQSAMKQLLKNTCG